MKKMMTIVGLLSGLYTVSAQALELKPVQTKLYMGSDWGGLVIQTGDSGYLVPANIDIIKKVTEAVQSKKDTCDVVIIRVATSSGEDKSMKILYSVENCIASDPATNK